ncbi:MAG: hypothetical protein Q9180_004570 [Flavoplaca navasiana]
MPVLISRSGRLGTMNKIEKNRPSQSSHWEEYRDIVQHLYVTEDKSLPDVVDEMKRKHQFYATERQYKRRITEWQLDKNVKDEEMRAIIAVEAMRLRQGKKSTFHVRGRRVDRKKIDRFVQRKRIDRNALDSLPGMQQSTNSTHHAASEYASILPESVRCSTPPDELKALPDISKSYRGLIPAKDTQPNATAIDIENYDDREFDSQNERVRSVHDVATKVTARTEAPGFPYPSTTAQYEQPAGSPDMSNIGRTLSDIYQDELYNPPNTSTPSNQSHRYRLQEDSFPQNENSVFTDLLQAAQNRHIRTKSVPSSTNETHEHSPFTQGSSYATWKEQQKAAVDACVLLQHQPTPSDFAPPRTISPKDVTLDYNEAGEDG